MKKMILRFSFILGIIIFSPFAGIGNDSLTKHHDSLITLLDIVSDELKPRIYLQLSELLLPTDTKQSKSYAFSALKLANVHQLEPEQIGSLNQLSTIYYYQKQVEKSLEYAQKALAILQTYSREAHPAGNLNILEGKCLFNKARASRALFPDSIKVVLDDLTIATEKLENTKEYKTLADAYNILGQAYLAIDMNDEGLENCEKALLVYRLLGDKRSMALLYGRIAHEVDRVSSIKYTQRAINLYAEANDSVAMAHFLISLAYQTRNILDTKTNLGYLDLAFKIFQNRQAYEGMVYCLFHRYGYYIDILHQPDSGLKYLLMAARISKQHQIGNDAGHIYISLGTYYHIKNKYPLAEYYFNLADSITQYSPESPERIRYLAELGKYYTDLKKYDQAEKIMLESLRLAREKKEPQLVNIAYRCLYTLYKAKGDFENALVYYKSKKELQDSTLNKHTERLVSEMQIKYETKKKEDALELMKENDKLKNAELKRQRNTIYAIALGLATLIGFLTLLARQYQKKRSAYAQLMKKNLELIKKEERNIKDKSQVALNNHLDPNIHQQIMRKLSYQIKHNKIFLQNDLSLSKLAKKCHTNSSYLSRAINAEYQSNFSGFVNSLRIKEAQKIMANPQYSTYSLEGISESVGFKSKSVFNAAFKKYTGVTPSFYLEYLLETGAR